MLTWTGFFPPIILISHTIVPVELYHISFLYSWFNCNKFFKKLTIFNLKGYLFFKIMLKLDKTKKQPITDRLQSCIFFCISSKCLSDLSQRQIIGRILRDQIFTGDRRPCKTRIGRTAMAQSRKSGQLIPALTSHLYSFLLLLHLPPRFKAQ